MASFLSQDEDTGHISVADQASWLGAEAEVERRDPTMAFVHGGSCWAAPLRKARAPLHDADDEANSKPESDGMEGWDDLDKFLVQKLDPRSKTHLDNLVETKIDSTMPPLSMDDRPGAALMTGYSAPSLRKLPEFRKFKELFFEKSQERANETAGIALHEPIIDRKRGKEKDPSSESSKVAQNILQNCVLSAIRKAPERRRSGEVAYIVQYLSTIEFLHNLSKDMRLQLSEGLDPTSLLEYDSTGVMTEYDRQGNMLGKVDKKGYVMRKGDPADGFYILFKGSAKVQLADGRVVGTYKPGDSFGEVALFSSQPRSASIIATEGEHIRALSLQSCDSRSNLCLTRI